MVAIPVRVSPRLGEYSLRKAAFAGLLFVTLIGSFFATLWALDARAPSDTAESDQSDAARLATATIFDRSDLIEAAVGVGLHSSDSMRGAVDEIRRLNASEVAISGWLADTGGEGEPLNLLVFVAGKHGGMTQTRGERPDVAQAVHLAAGAEKNVAYQMSLRCHAGDQLVIVGVGSDKQYIYLSAPRCP
jgi:hypothetical protein